MSTERISYALMSRPYGHCHVVLYTEDNYVNRVEFWSYNTMVIGIENGAIWCTGLYSSTTIRQISDFIREWSYYSYKDIKEIVNTGAVLNVDMRVIDTVAQKYLCYGKRYY